MKFNICQRTILSWRRRKIISSWSKDNISLIRFSTLDENISRKLFAQEEEKRRRGRLVSWQFIISRKLLFHGYAGCNFEYLLNRLRLIFSIRLLRAFQTKHDESTSISRFGQKSRCVGNSPIVFTSTVCKLSGTMEHGTADESKRIPILIVSY